MIKIRLAREGVKKKPFFRIVAAQSYKKNNGESLDVIGFWNPAKKEKQIDKTKIKLWVSRGAQISKKVEKLLS